MLYIGGGAGAADRYFGKWQIKNGILQIFGEKVKMWGASWEGTGILASWEWIKVPHTYSYYERVVDREASWGYYNEKKTRTGEVWVLRDKRDAWLKPVEPIGAR